MPYSYNEVGAKSPGDTIAVTFTFLDREHVSVTVDGVVTTLWSWINDGLVEAGPGFPSGTKTRIKRTTPKGPLESTLQGSAVFDWEGVNVNDLQILYIQQEAEDEEAERQAQIYQLETEVGGVLDSVAASVATASQHASTATTKASEAVSSATTASTKAAEASTKAAEASTKAAEAAASATAAANAMSTRLETLGADALGADGKIVAPLSYKKKQVSISTNGIGSTGFPGTFGSTWSFGSGDIGRAFDVHYHKQAADELYFRGHTDDVTPKSWKRLAHSENFSSFTSLTPSTFTLRTLLERSTDVIDIKDFGFIVSDTVGSETTNDAALDRLITYAAANPGCAFRFRGSDIIRISAVGKIIPRCHLQTNNAVFKFVGSAGGTASPVLTLAQYVTFDRLNLESISGATFRRFIRLNGDNSGQAISLTCAAQVANWSGSNLDFAVAVYGHRNKIGSIKVKKADWAIFIYGEGSAGFPQLGTTIGEFDVEDYSVGVVIRNVTKFTGMSFKASGKGPNALPDPGYNAVLIEGARDSTFGLFNLADAMEHNLRLGGPHSGEQLTKNCSFGPILSKRSGQSGVKVWSGLKTDIITGLTFSTINVIDCGGYSQGLGGTGGFNDFGVMIQAVSHSTFASITVKKDTYTYSALDGGYFSQCENVTVGLFQAFNASRNLLRISEYNGNATDSNSTNSLRFGQVVGTGQLAAGIVIECPVTVMRDIVIDDFNIIGGTDIVHWTGAADRALQRCYFRGLGRGQSGVLFNVPVGTNLKTVDKWTA